MKTIEINHIAKTEGHLSFIGALLGGEFSEARLETQEGARLIEGILLNRNYYEAPIVTSRICGVCPIVHNLTSIKALEDALEIKPTLEIELLRKMLINAQWIHSHALHAFFLSFPDFVGVSNNFNFVKKYPKESKLAMEIRTWGIELARIIGGRTVHPINSVVGGFNVEPDFAELSELLMKKNEMLLKIKQIFKFVLSIKLPDFFSPTNYTCLKSKQEYAIYDGEVYFFDSKTSIPADQFLFEITETLIPYEAVKRVKHDGKVIMVGAISRINNNSAKLNPDAKELLNQTKIKLPWFNPFYNLYAQIIEIAHNVEEVDKLFKKYQKLRQNKSFTKNLKVKFKIKAGKGYAVMEAPRGILYHEYELDNKGKLTYANFVPPTTIFLSNLEKDLKQFLVENKKLSDKKRDELIKALIRAYDPCISCATH